MKYALLTKEQIETLHKEFAQFLASQQIDSKEWEDIKLHKPKIAQEELELFSDVVWDDVLTKTKYIDHISPKQIDLFNCSEIGIHRIVVKISKENFDFFDIEDSKWFLENLSHNSLTFFQAQKKYQKERILELFDLIQKGGVISKGELYKNMLLKIG